MYLHSPLARVLGFIRISSTSCVRKYNSFSKPRRNELEQVLWDRTEDNRIRNQLFETEKTRQKSFVPRLEKIEVNLYNIQPHENVTLLMNKNVSTPYDCARHISEFLTKRSVLAFVDDKYLWDMHRPLESDCNLTFKHFKDDNPGEVNKAFWRSCSFMLGMVIQRAFKDDIPVVLHSWPKPSIKSGTFIYDAQLPTLSGWKPTKDELRALTAMFWKLKSTNFNFERMEVSLNLAKEMFKDNEFKFKQLDHISNLSKNDDSKVTLYRLSDHIDFSIGPMIPNTGHLGRVSVTCVHKLNSDIDNLYRFQGVAIPTQLPIHFFPFRVLLDRGAKPCVNDIPN